MALLDLQGMSARHTGTDAGRCASDVSVVLCMPWPCSQLSIVLCPQ
jgi:hypothetical protein